MKYLLSIIFLILAQSTFAQSDEHPQPLYGVIRNVSISSNGSVTSLKDLPCNHKELSRFLPSQKQAVYLDTVARVIKIGCWKDIGNSFQVIWEDGTVAITEKSKFIIYSEYHNPIKK